MNRLNTHLNHYILEDGEVKLVTLMEWAHWFEKHENRIIAQDELKNGVRVSTVFLGIDHSFGFGDKPVLWETMIFGGKYDQYQDRYSSNLDALEGHIKALTLAKNEYALQKRRSK